MTNYKLNIGLEGTNYSKVIETLNNYRGRYYKDYSVKLMLGEYNGQKEQTAVVELIDSSSAYTILKLVEYWTTLLNQECIALAYASGSDVVRFYKTYEPTIASKDSKPSPTFDIISGTLVYNMGFKGEKMLFDPKYFLT